MYAGKTTEQKRELVKRLSRDFDEVVSVKPESLHILFHDMDKADWGTRGALGSDSAPK
jgi:4-oxalocrotonate tautomerase